MLLHLSQSTVHSNVDCVAIVFLQCYLLATNSPQLTPGRQRSLLDWLEVKSRSLQGADPTTRDNRGLQPSCGHALTVSWGPCNQGGVNHSGHS